MTYTQLDDKVYDKVTARDLLFRLLPTHYGSWSQSFMRGDGDAIRIVVAVDSAEKRIALEVNDELRAAVAHWRMTYGKKL